MSSQHATAFRARMLVQGQHDTTQVVAGYHFNQDTSDPYGLPGESYAGQQGMACEELPSRGASSGSSQGAYYNWCWDAYYGWYYC
jgi:hypothetical protein